MKWFYVQYFRFKKIYLQKILSKGGLLAEVKLFKLIRISQLIRQFFRASVHIPKNVCDEVYYLRYLMYVCYQLNFF